jgi:hypothetical protein
MRNLRVLILLSAVLVLSGVVCTSTTAFAFTSTKSAVVLVCYKNGGTTQVNSVDPGSTCAIAQNDSCAASITTLLNNGCKLESDYEQEGLDQGHGFLFICRAPLCP